VELINFYSTIFIPAPKGSKFGFAIAKTYDYIKIGYMERTGKALDAFHARTISNDNITIAT